LPTVERGIASPARELDRVGLREEVLNETVHRSNVPLSAVIVVAATSADRALCA
jgi:hypothetical protein